jgi:5-hydroxyisourate hydrolase-like protein (transthyretin family)
VIKPDETTWVGALLSYFKIEMYLKGTFPLLEIHVEASEGEWDIADPCSFDDGTIKGTVYDSKTQKKLPHAAVEIYNANTNTGVRSLIKTMYSDSGGGYGSVKGNASDADIGENIPNAKIDLYYANSGEYFDTVTTDQNGVFDFGKDTLDAGDYKLEISASGYQNATENATVTAGEDTIKVIELTPDLDGTERRIHGSFEVQQINEFGTWDNWIEPLSGLTVYFYQVNNNGSPNWNPRVLVATTSTNGAGEYDFGLQNIEDRQYYLIETIYRGVPIRTIPISRAYVDQTEEQLSGFHLRRYQRNEDNGNSWLSGTDGQDQLLS